MNHQLNNHTTGPKSLASSRSSPSDPHTPIRDGVSNETLRPFSHTTTRGSPLPLRTSSNSSLDIPGGVNPAGTMGRARLASPSPLKPDIMSEVGNMSQKELLLRFGQQYSENKSLSTENKALKQEVREKDAEYKFEIECEKDKVREALAHAQALETKVSWLEKEHDRLSTAHASSASTISELQEKLDRANKTILVQSNQIRNPRDGRNYGPQTIDTSRLQRLTINDYNATSQSTQESMEMVPWRNRGREGPRTPTHGRFPSNAQMPMGRGTSQHRGGYGESGGFDRPRFNPQQNSTYKDSQYGHPRSQGQSFESVVHQPASRRSGPPPNVSAMVSRVFNAAIDWCKKFCNVPDVERDNGLPQALWGELGCAPIDPFITGLLSDANTRYLAIAKLVIGRIARFALYKKLLNQFKDGYDQRLAAVRNNTYTGIEFQLRRQNTMVYNQVAHEIANDPDWNAHVGNLVQSAIDDLWRIIELLLDHASSPNEAWTGLRQIFEQGVAAGLAMSQALSMFTIDYPPVSTKEHSSLFVKGSMSNVDPYFKQDPITLGRMGVKVRLAVTPSVVDRSLEDPTMEPRVIVNSKVLLKH